MSTRSNIAIKVAEKDLNKELHLKINGEDVEQTVIATQEKPYLRIYCHFDGYLSYNGAELSRCTDYEEILSFILHGDTSSIEEIDGHISTNAYAVREGFDRGNKPEVLPHPENCEDYLYSFEDGKWYFDDGEDTALLDEALKNEDYD